ncbi:recombinase RecA [candidate division BRC1 bacterium SM23_51]|nr:MAG: recombinase RecA [candidate division BRC1 bacterium SM23_51]
MSRDAQDKQKALELALTQIERSHGKGSIMRYGQRPADMGVRAIPSGALSLDAALGVWGYPRGRIVEVFGPEASGKTTLALHAVAEAQRQGGVAAYIDAEHAVDPTYTKAIGVDLDALLISQPDTGEQALDIVETLIRSNALHIIVVDSVAALSPRAEIEGEMGDTFVGLQARMMSQAMRKLTAAVSRSGTCLIFVNQIREKIGVMFGPSETTPGGRALKFYASVRVDIRRIATLKDGDKSVGTRVRTRVVKNKLAAPFKDAEFEILFGKGISAVGDLLDLAVKHQIISKSGAWFSLEGTRLGQGRENTRTFLDDNGEVRAAIEAKVKEKIGYPLAAKETAAGKKD